MTPAKSGSIHSDNKLIFQSCGQVQQGEVYLSSLLRMALALSAHTLRVQLSIYSGCACWRSALGQDTPSIAWRAILSSQVGCCFWEQKLASSCLMVCPPGHIKWEMGCEKHSITGIEASIGSGMGCDMSHILAGECSKGRCLEQLVITPQLWRLTRPSLLASASQIPSRGLLLNLDTCTCSSR